MDGAEGFLKIGNVGLLRRRVSAEGADLIQQIAKRNSGRAQEFYDRTITGINPANQRLLDQALRIPGEHEPVTGKEQQSRNEQMPRNPIDPLEEWGVLRLRVSTVDTHSRAPKDIPLVIEDRFYPGF